MNLPTKNTRPFKVYIGSGEFLMCENICTAIPLHMQWLDMKIDLYVLPMKGAGILLGYNGYRNWGA